MNKVIPLLIVVNFMILHSCRPSGQLNEEPEDFSAPLSHSDKGSDTAKLKEVDPDPPVKDGQDWKNSQP